MKRARDAARRGADDGSGGLPRGNRGYEFVVKFLESPRARPSSLGLLLISARRRVPPGFDEGVRGRGEGGDARARWGGFGSFCVDRDTSQNNERETFKLERVTCHVSATPNEGGGQTQDLRQS